ncbi:MAG: flavin reductase family protein [Alicyclobacillus macrosporangiidus]|uniref:flavin reductase family protein n=1 Tax=Alicyclobacillus macrosporangiidus TaxID=392015 RepID=UPI0026F1BD35|nr:flavin reductase family protein [Alicyclobacillus macrosporangiidus]MCL6599478.1 flavin reductase family protein [Alicyclobacillus macrosporangiidus]
MDSRTFRNIAGTFATGVTVVTTRRADGRPVGMTVNSFTSLSLNPPLVLVTIAKNASLFDDFVGAEGFVVNILSAAQEWVSRQFAAKGVDRFAGVDFSKGITGLPVLAEVLGYFECETVQRYEGGDHVILVGEVQHGDFTAGRPLLFFMGKYEQLADAKSVSR